MRNSGSMIARTHTTGVAIVTTNAMKMNANGRSVSRIADGPDNVLRTT